uniref:Rho guanine nucleotide exchange factor (GEF) 1b n=1 Tax=Salarias fasciatus TaxID=181472 RepID=A0A672FCP6_SALFA
FRARSNRKCCFAMQGRRLRHSKRQGVFGAQSFNPAMSIIGAEDEDFENDLNDCTHFNSIEQLKDRPTHLLVFMQHVILQFDPAPLLCYLHAELLKNLSAKETKKQFVEFYNTFLDKGATLRVTVPPMIASELDRSRPELFSDDTQKRFALDVQSLQVPEASFIIACLGPLLFSQSIFTAVAFYMKHLGVKNRSVDSKKSKGGFFRRHWRLPRPSPDSARGRPRGRKSSTVRRRKAEQQRSIGGASAPPSHSIYSLSLLSELFATEHAHVRKLTVLQTIFSRPLERESLLTATELATIFPNLDEILEMHCNFYESLKKLRVKDNFVVKSISTTVLNRFEGTEGEWFQKLTARFCSHQSWALDQIKSRQKREPRFNSFILEAESKPQCRRLQLKDIIPIEMQRLTKYPLLLENIAKNTEDLAEKEGIHFSAECCRKILNHVNEEVKVMENLLTLKDYQRRLDTSGLKPSNELYTEYKNIDLTQKKMIYEGPLTWKVTKEKAIDVQCVLLGDLLVLLQRQDDKMVLKCQSKSNIVGQEGKQMLSPIIKLDSVFLREVATDRKAFYVIFTWDSGAQIYELVAQSVGEMKTWTEIIKSTVDDLKKSGAPMRLSLPPGGGGTPFSPTYVQSSVCLLSVKVHPSQNFSSPSSLSVRINVPSSPTENGGLKSNSGETAALHQAHAK